jgi:general secretion pathway protein K
VTRIRERGAVLVLVLWILTLATVVAARYSATTRTETLGVTHLVSAARARALAEAGLWYGFARLTFPHPAGRWLADGRVYAFRLADHEIKISMQDQSGLIDLNRAPSQLLDALLERTSAELVSRAPAGAPVDPPAATGCTPSGRLDAGSAPPAPASGRCAPSEARPDTLTTQGVENPAPAEEMPGLSAAIVDWRDPDRHPSPLGAEDDSYAAAGFDYGAKDGPFNTVGELQLVAGITPALLEALKPKVTVHSPQATVNVAVAPVEVLRALPGIEDSTVEQVMEARENGDVTALPGALPASLRPYVGASGGTTYEVRAQASVGGTVARIGAIIVTVSVDPARPYTILAWDETAGPLPAAAEPPAE